MSAFASSDKLHTINANIGFNVGMSIDDRSAVHIENVEAVDFMYEWPMIIRPFPLATCEKN